MSQDTSLIFGRDIDNNDTFVEQKKSEIDMSKYTVVDADHLDEDKVDDSQKYSLFSFLSPEGIMNCNIRAVKFRGAFSSMEEAEKAVKELEKEDPYFKIFIGESGKWLEFDPPVERVEKEKSTNKQQQRIIDEQRKQRMAKMNELAGKHKQNIDKKEKGKKERIEESKKSGAADHEIDKRRNKKNETKNKSPQNETKSESGPETEIRSSRNMSTRERLRKKLAEKQAKAQNEKRMKELENSDMDKKVESINKINSDLQEENNKIEKTEQNIQKIKCIT